MSTPEKQDDWILIYDGVEYGLPLKVTPREDAMIQRISGFSWRDSLQHVAENSSVISFAALLIVAMRRKDGSVNEDAILDDPAFLDKFELRQVGPEVVDALPPGLGAAAVAREAAPEPAVPSASSSETPAPSGSPL